MKSTLPSAVGFAFALGYLFLASGCTCLEPLGGPGEPTIEFTFIPSVGSTLELQGSVAHVQSCEHRIAVYIFVNGGWYTKPSYAEPLTEIRVDGNWVCDITTGGVDIQATRIAAFLITASYSPPLQDGSSFELPAELGENALDSVETTRPPSERCVVETCQLTPGLPAGLLTCRNWITFAPPRPFNPDRGTFPSEVELRAALQILYCEGWRGLVTYSLDGTLRLVPRIAKEIGFVEVIAGLFWFDDAQLSRERAAVMEEAEFIDGIVLGNEGLMSGRYTRERLAIEMGTLRADTGLPVTTTESSQGYFEDPTLLELGDWVFPNIHPWFENIRTVPEAVEFVEAQYSQLEELAPDRPLVVKESWWPTAGDEGASEQSQADFFSRLSQSRVKFVFGEAFDQYWKTQEGPQGPHWGFHNDNSEPKQLVRDLTEQYNAFYSE